MKSAHASPAVAISFFLEARKDLSVSYQKTYSLECDVIGFMYMYMRMHTYICGCMCVKCMYAMFALLVVIEIRKV